MQCRSSDLKDSLAVIDSFVDSLPLKSSLKVDLLQLKAQVVLRLFSAPHNVVSLVLSIGTIQ